MQRHGTYLKKAVLAGAAPETFRSTETGLSCERSGHQNFMPDELYLKILRLVGHYFRTPPEPSPAPVREPPSPLDNPDAPVREPDPEEPEQI